MLKNILIGVALVTILAAGAAIGWFWPTLQDRLAAGMNERVTAMCDEIAAGRPWVMRECMEQVAREKVAWMLDQIDLFCSGHPSDQHCPKTQRAAWIRLYGFRQEYPLVKADKCMTSSRDENDRIDLDKAYFCLVGEASTN
jgi:hypothetical protein